MKRQYAPTILLYGLGLTAALSLLYNGFLLREQNRQQVYEYESSVYAAEAASWQQQLLDCSYASQRKDSLIRQLEKMYTSKPPSVAGQQEHPVNASEK